MAAIKRIGVITSGGDCGGLNAVIKGVAREAYSLGIESVVIPNGYAGLYNLVELKEVVFLNAERVSRTEASLAGSEAGQSGTSQPSICKGKQHDITEHAFRNLTSKTAGQGTQRPVRLCRRTSG